MRVFLTGVLATKGGYGDEIGGWSASPIDWAIFKTIAKSSLASWDNSLLIMVVVIN